MLFELLAIPRYLLIIYQLEKTLWVSRICIMAPLFDRLTSDNKFHMPIYWRDVKRSLSLGDYTYPTPYWQCVPEYPVSHTPDNLFSGQVQQSCALAAAGSPWRVPLHLDHMEIVRLHINWRNILEPLDFKALEFSSLSTIEKPHSLEYKLCI